MSTAQTAFGHRLRESRERRGLSIDVMAASTKINASLFVELERGELKHWPAGIYRRAFFREQCEVANLALEAHVGDEAMHVLRVDAWGVGGIGIAIGVSVFAVEEIGEVVAVVHGMLSDEG